LQNLLNYQIWKTGAIFEVEVVSTQCKTYFHEASEIVEAEPASPTQRNCQ